MKKDKYLVEVHDDDLEEKFKRLQNENEELRNQLILNREKERERESTLNTNKNKSISLSSNTNRSSEKESNIYYNKTEHLESTTSLEQEHSVSKVSKLYDIIKYIFIINI